jgi:hypothetical protein
MDVDLEKLAGEIIDNVKQMVGSQSWAEFTDQDKELLSKVAKDAAELQFKVLSGEEELKGEVAMVNATIKNIAASRIIPIQVTLPKIFWSAFERASITLISAFTQSVIASI